MDIARRPFARRQGQRKGHGAHGLHRGRPECRDEAPGATHGLDHLIDLHAEVFEPGALQPWRTAERDDDPVEAGAAAEKPAYQTALTSVLPAMKMMMNEPGVQSAARIS